jgi:hypothetical protein
MFFTYNPALTGDIALWSIKNKRLHKVASRLPQSDLPLSLMRSAQDDKFVICYNCIALKFIVIVKSQVSGIESEVYRMDPSLMCNGD